MNTCIARNPALGGDGVDIRGVGVGSGGVGVGGVGIGGAGIGDVGVGDVATAVINITSDQDNIIIIVVTFFRGSL